MEKNFYCYHVEDLDRNRLELRQSEIQSVLVNREAWRFNPALLLM